MKTINYKTLKSITYVGLTLSAIAHSSEVQAKHRAENEYFGVGNLVGPRSGIFRGNLDRVQRDINRPQKENHFQKYYDLKNEIIAKYENEYPELRKYRRSACPKAQSNGIVADAKEQAEKAKALRIRMEERDKRATAKGKKVVDIIGAVSEVVIDKAVESDKSRGTLVKLKDAFVETTKSLFDF